MAHCVDYEEFAQLKEVVNSLVAENQFQRSLILAQASLTRRQVQKALNVDSSTIWRLTKAGTLKTYDENGKIFYDIDSIRSYLMAKKLLPTAIDNRILSACYASLHEGNCKKPGLTKSQTGSVVSTNTAYP